MHVFQSMCRLKGSRKTSKDENLKHGHNGQEGLTLSSSRANRFGTHIWKFEICFVLLGNRRENK